MELYLFYLRDYDYLRILWTGLLLIKTNRSLPKRVEIVKKLLAGENHHDIADEAWRRRGNRYQRLKIS